MKKFDLFEMRDEKTVLKNPHKGWYWHFIDNGFANIKYQFMYFCDSFNKSLNK